MARNLNRPHLIYFAQGHGGRVDQLVKIGCSSNVHVRLNRIRSSYRTNVNLLSTAITERADPYGLEKFVHGYLSKYLAYRNEWFFPYSEVMRVATECALDNEWLEWFCATEGYAPRFEDRLTTEYFASQRDHAASERVHFAYRQHEKRTVYYPMRAAALKLANDITAAICAPSKLIAFPSTVETGKAA